MPWAKLAEPSLGLCILQSVLTRNGIDSQVRHFNIELLRYLTASSYTAIADINALNEFLFTYTLQPDVSETQLVALHDAAGGLLAKESELSSRGRSHADFMDYFLTIRNVIVPKYLNECADYVVAQDCSMVGFTCMYDQTFASLALATLIRARLPRVMIVFGGYALEGAAGLEILKCFDCVDAVAFGDGEPAIAGLAAASIGEMDLARIPNVAWRTDRGIQQTARVRIDMCASPEPDFTDFFNDVAELEARDSVKITPGVLPIETSRGCWWGQKHHCTFCGIDEQTLEYRQRPPEQVLEMIGRLSAKYPGKTLRIVDYILPHTYFTTVLPRLAADRSGPRLTCEVKSNLTAEKMSLLREAGFVQIQPGIESFSTAVLRRMRKGVTGIQNVLTLKLGKANGLKIDWNLIYGFPDDEVKDYEELVKVIPHLYHLDPPFSCGDVFVTRFAPLQANHDLFQLKPPTRHSIYDVLFSADYAATIGLSLDNICYFFDSQWTVDEPLLSLYQIIDGQIEHWKRAAVEFKGARLSHRADNDHVAFVDRRLRPSSPVTIEYPREFMDVYSMVQDTIMTVGDVASRASALSRSRTIDIVEQLLNDRILLREGDRVVGLSIEAMTPAAAEAFA